MVYLVIVLSLLQILSLYLIVLLFLRFSRLQELERQQKQTIGEMEEAVSAYLLEIQFENDRFLNELEKRKAPEAKTEPAETAAEAEPEPVSPAAALHGQGYSVEEIARQLGVGKTEVELMLKFGKK